jgi:tRNA-modifying protein YgfZ
LPYQHLIESFVFKRINLVRSDSEDDLVESGRFFVDVSNRAILRLTGSDSLDLIQRISTNDMLQVQTGKAIQTVFTNEKGRIIDVSSVVREANGDILIVGQCNAHELKNWIEKFIIMEDIMLTTLSDDFKHFMVYGSFESPLQYSDFLVDIDARTFSETLGDTTLFHLIVPEPAGGQLSNQLRSLGFRAAGMADYSKFRVQHGIPAFPSELIDSYNPLEANLWHLVSFTKGCYVGQEVVARLDTYKKVQRKLVRLKMGELPSHLPKAIFRGADEWGEITSAAKQDGSDGVEGLGYIRLGADAAMADLCFRDNDRTVVVSVEP